MTIEEIWLNIKALFRGIKVSLSHLYGNAKRAVSQIGRFFSGKNSASTYAVGTIGTLESSDILLVIKKLEQVLENPSLNGLAKDLGITKEGVLRLIWSLGGVQNIKDGSGAYSSEMISLVRNAVLKERISRQTISLLDLQPSLMKEESQLTNKQWRVNVYGTKIMAGHCAVNAIEGSS